MKPVKYLILTFLAILYSYCSFAVIGPVTGSTSLCAGDTTTLYDTTSGGVWSSSNVAIVSVNSATGLVTAIGAGSATITYTTGSGFVIASVAVNPKPNVYALSGGGSFCAGASTTISLSNSTAGISYQLYNSGTIAGAPLVGTGSPLDLGSVTSAGTYSVVATNTVTGCMAAMGTVTVNTLTSPSAISLSGPLCQGGTVTASNSVTGGTWASSNPAVATISSFGIISVNSIGTAIISYTLTSTGCATATSVTVNPSPAAIGGSYGICAGATNVLTDAGGGTWSSSDPAIATVNTSGIVTGVSPGTASIFYTLSTGCNTYAPVTVNIMPGAISGPASFCAGTTAYYSSPSFGGNWYSSYSTIATIGSTSGVATGVVAGSTNIIYALSSGCSVSQSVTINALPSPITGTLNGCAGSALSLSSTSGGTWTSGSTGVATITAPGVVNCITTGTTLITNTLSSGCATSATITVNAAPATFTITGGGAYCPGGSGVHLGLTGSAGSGCTRYQLYIGSSPVGSPVTGTGSAIDFGFQTTVGTYSAMAINSCTGCSSSMTGAAAISLYPAPVVYTLSVGSGGGYCAGSTGADLTLSGSNTGVNYALFNPSAVAVLVLSGTGTTLDFGLQTLPGSYMVVATNPSTTCTSTMAGPGTLSVIPAPTVYSVTGGGTYCAGGTGEHVDLAGSDAGVSYQLYQGTTPVGLAIAGTGGAIDLGAHTATGAYTVVATNTAFGCTAPMASSASIAIAPLPTAYPLTGGGTFCPGGGSHIGLTYAASGYNYQLYLGSSAIGAPVGGSNLALDFGLETTAGSYTVIATNASTSCSASMTGTAVININPTPSVYNVTGGGAYCAGGSGIPVGLDNSDIGINYKLYDGSVLLAIIPGSGSSLNFGYRTAAGSYTITAVNSTTACADTMSGAANVSINPLPAAYTLTGGGTYCPGGVGVHMGMTGSSPGVSYQLYNGVTADSTPVAGTGAALDFGIKSTMGTYHVIAVNTITGCSNSMAGAPVVNIASLPIVHSMAGGGSYCTGDTGVHVYLSGSVTTNSYQLYHNWSRVGSPLAGTGSGLDFGLETITGSYTVIATNASTCSDTMAAAAIVGINPSVSPSVTVTVSPGDTVCAGTTVTFTATPFNGGSTPTYQWYINGVAVTGATLTTFTRSTLYDYDTVTVEMTSSATCATPSVAEDGKRVHIVAYPTITGSSSVCLGSTTTLTGTAGGEYRSGSTTIATVAIVGGTPGVVTGMSVGTTIITYTVAPGCSSFQVMSVNPVPAITASIAAVSCSGDYTLSGSGGVSYTWSPATALSCTACAVTTSSPTDVILYTLSGTSALGCIGTDTVSVDANKISGNITYSGGSLFDSLKVWLIQYNPSDSTLTGLDSTYTCMSGGIPYYEFKDKAPGSYLVKAKLLGAAPGTTGYLPTYSTSTSYWYDAASATHTYATDVLNVTLLYGTVPYGPGFIGGLISMGANRGTTTDVPAQHMTVYLKDALTGKILTYAYTDATGAYAFPNLGYGSYIVYPEDFGYTTTPSGTIDLADFTDTARGINFKEHLNAKTITPIAAAVNGVKTINAGEQLLVYPNPAKDNLGIAWSNEETGPADVVITDVTGKEVYRTTLDITSPSGSQQISLLGLNDGIYFINIRSLTISYNSKLLIQY